MLTGAKAGSLFSRQRWPITKFPKGMSTKAEVSRTESLDLNHHLVEVIQNLKGPPENMVECLSNFCSCMVDLAIPFEFLHRLWDTITALSLRPFGLAKHGSTYCHPIQYESLYERLGNKTHIYVSQDVNHKLPFLISQAAILSLESGSDQKTNPLVAFPTERTLMYAGVPVKLTSDLLGPERFTGFGDVMVEPFAANSIATSPVPDGPDVKMAVKRITEVFNFGDLSAWGGRTTNYFGDWQAKPDSVDFFKKHPCLETLGEKFMTHSWFWSPLDVGSDDVPVSRFLPTADAGVYDDEGHLGLLRRGVKKMVIVDSSAVHDNLTGVQMTNINEMSYLQAAFGVPGSMTPVDPPGSPNPFEQENFVKVFESSGYSGLWRAIQECYAAKEPAVFRGEFMVVDNPHFGIIGGWKVQIVWIIALPSATFRAGLPPQTAKHLKEYFPNYLAGEPMSQFELSALSQYGSWLINELALTEIENMLHGDPCTDTMV